jgi:hypothetical protein
MLALQDMCYKACANVVAYLSVTELDQKFHNIIHSVERILCLGPGWTTAMWKFESMWSVLG